MFRIFTTVAILALTAGAAQAAESLTTRIHAAAVEACTPERSASLPVSHYSAITEHCVKRISAAAVAKYQAEAEAKTRASTAAVVGN
jgi:hypothetical protein